MTTVREIAEFAGVSKSTVSLVLNNKPGVSDEMRQTVLDAVNELESMHIAAALPAQAPIELAPEPRSQMLSMMVLHPPVLRSSYVFSQVLQGIQSAAELYNVQLRLVVNDPQASAQHVSHLYLTDDYLRPDGVLIFGAQREEPLLQKAIERGLPCLVLGREISKYGISGIERDETHYGYLLTQHLLDLGHQSIAFVGGEATYDYTHNRAEGYQQALYDAGLTDVSSKLYFGDGAQQTHNALENHPDLTAIIYVNDSYAAEGTAILRKRQISIPDQLSIASFDNTEFACNNTVPITSIAYNHFKEGQWAVKLLLDHIRHPFIDKSHLMFKGDLIVRASTAPPLT